MGAVAQAQSVKVCQPCCHCDCLRVFDSGDILRKLIESVFDQKGRKSAASVRYRQALANFRRKVRIGIGLCRLAVDPGKVPKPFKGYACVGGAHVVGVVGQ